MEPSQLSSTQVTGLKGISVILLACLPTIWPLMAHAERADRTKPMVIEAGKQEVLLAENTTILTGGVVITKGTMQIRADRVELKKDAQDHVFATATGKLTTFRQKREGLDEYMDGAAERIEYDGKAETVKLIRRAQLKRLEKERVVDEIYGAQINYDAKTESYSAESGAAGQSAVNPTGRVRIVLQPRERGDPKSADPRSTDPRNSEPKKQ